MVEDGRSDAASRIAAMYDDHVDLVFAYLARRVGAQLARDLTGDVFRIGLERFSSFDPTLGSARSWLLGIATNEVRHHWRSEQRRLRAFTRAGRRDTAGGDPEGGVDDHLDAMTRLDRVIDAIERLSPEDRDLLVLVAWEGCSSEQVGEVLSDPAGDGAFTAEPDSCDVASRRRGELTMDELTMFASLRPDTEVLPADERAALRVSLFGSATDGSGADPVLGAPPSIADDPESTLIELQPAVWRVGPRARSRRRVRYIVAVATAAAVVVAIVVVISRDDRRPHRPTASSRTHSRSRHQTRSNAPATPPRT